MRSGGALLLLIVGILLLWIVTTGRLAQLMDAWKVLAGSATATATDTGDASATGPAKNIVTPLVPQLVPDLTLVTSALNAAGGTTRAAPLAS